jgi:hypothetical protein
MTLPSELLPVGLLGSSTAAGGYQVSRSLRFNSADSAYLNRTPGSAGNRRTWTWAGWVKRTPDVTGVDSLLFASNDAFYFYGEILVFELNVGGGALIVPSQSFRDFSAWMHIQVALDTTQSTANNRVKIYVNGITTIDGGGYPAQNYECVGINNTSNHQIGVYGGAANGNFYLADIHFIDGQALTPSSFTETNATTGQLIPKLYTGSYGTNGWKLNFSDNSTAAALGTDTSGNGNTWTVNNVSVSDFTVAVTSGGLPIYNTSGAYGGTQISGLRSDSNSSYLSLATALGTGSGLDLTDQNVSGRTSGLKTITNAGSVSASSASQFYSGSARFTGATGSRAYLASSSDFAFGTGDFTVEFWVKSEATDVNPSFYRRFFTTGPDSTASVQLGHIVNTSGIVIYYTSTTVLQSTTNIVNKWCHIALTRASGTVRLFVNGVLEASGTDTSDKTNNTPSIGNYNNTDDGRMQGELQDLRVYKGIAKYTSSFTVTSRTLAAGNDSLVDTPTSYGTDTGVGGTVRGNYASLNPLANGSNVTLSNGNLDYSCASSTNTVATSSIAMSSGKWYCEFTVTGGSHIFGLYKASLTGNLTYLGVDANGWGYYSDGEKWTNGTGSAYGNSYTTNDVIGVAFDADAGSLYFYKNGAVQNSGTAAFTGLTSGPYVFATGTDDAGTRTAVSNFGQRPFAYTAPSGFKALCDTNLPTPVIAKPNTVMDVVLYTGTGAALTPTSSLGFNPDWIWIKSRSAATDHALYDVVRGAQARLESNITDAEVTTDGGVTAFNSAGFTLGTLAQVNTSSATYAAWCWDAGTSTVTNTAGSITSQVRANASAGFSVVTYTQPAGAQTVGHGLGVAPELIIVKGRNLSNNWYIYSLSIPANNYLRLNATDASTAYGVALWNGTRPTSTVFSVGADLAGYNYVAYCFAPVAGYSSFGSYVGNGSSDGGFVYTGHRSRWILIKRTDTTANWRIFDTARDTYNVSSAELYPNLANAESAFFSLDINSNGFKIRTSDVNYNASGGTYIYAAFAESPFQYARAR